MGRRAGATSAGTGQRYRGQTGFGSPKHTRSDVLASGRHFSELPQEIEQGLLGEWYFGATAKPAGPKRQGVPSEAVHEVIGRLLNGPPVGQTPIRRARAGCLSPLRASAGADGPCRDPIMRHKHVLVGRAGYPRPAPSRVKGRRRRLRTRVCAHPRDEALGEWQCRHAVCIDRYDHRQADGRQDDPEARDRLSLENQHGEHDRGQTPWAEPADERDRRESRFVPSRASATGNMRATVSASTTNSSERPGRAPRASSGR